MRLFFDSRRLSSKIASTILLSICLLLSSSDLNAQVESAELGRGVNFGNILDAPAEGEWGYTLEPILFDQAVKVGFEHIRLPVSWTHYTETSEPFTIDPAILDRVEWAIDQALSRGLKIIVDVHHYDEIHDNPIDESPRALAMWEQIASRYAGYSDDVFFEILNEPHGQFNQFPELWNIYFREALAVIRETNPDRKVLVGPVDWNSIAAVESLSLPDDPNLIASVHNYAPFEFTHQGAFWLNPAPPIGLTWHPLTFTVQPGWQNWSWQTSVTREQGKFNVQFQSPYAGFYLHADQPIENARTLVFTTDEAMELDISILDPEFNGPVIRISAPAGRQRHLINLNSVGAPNTIGEIFIQNTGDSDPPSFNIDQMLVRSSGGVNYLLQTERFALRTLFCNAEQWANDNSIPLHLGEFGTHNEGDLVSRALWTSTVRALADQYNIDWSYWSIAGSMGFYEPDPDEFNIPLLRALIPLWQ